MEAAISTLAVAMLVSVGLQAVQVYLGWKMRRESRQDSRELRSLDKALLEANRETSTANEALKRTAAELEQLQARTTASRAQMEEDIDDLETQIEKLYTDLATAGVRGAAAAGLSDSMRRIREEAGRLALSAGRTGASSVHDHASSGPEEGSR